MIKVRYIRQYAIFIALLVICGILLYTSYTAIENKTIEQVNNEQFVHAEQAAAGIEGFFSTYNSSLAFLSGNTHITRLDGEGRQMMQVFFKNHAGEITSISRVNENGTILYTYPYESLTGSDISSQTHIRQVLTTRSIVVGDVFTSVQGFRSVAFHMPVFENGTFRGSIAILVPFDALARKNLGNIRVLDSGHAWAISPNGIILYSPRPDQIDKTAFDVYNASPSVLAIVQEAMKGKRGTGRYAANNGPAPLPVQYQAIYLPVRVGDSYWSIIVSTPEQEILSTIQGFRNNLFIISALLIITLLFFTYYVTRARGILKEEEKRRKAEQTLRESEEFNRSLVENLPDIIAIYDRNGLIKFVNRAGLELLKYAEGDVIGKPALMFIADYEREKLREKMNVRLSGVREPPYEVDIMAGGGEMITVILQAVPITFRNEPVVLLLMTNITEQRKLEQSMKIAKQKLNLMNIVALHDIHNKVIGIQGYVTLICESVTDPQARDFITREEAILKEIMQQILYTEEYQKIGQQPPQWQRLETIIDNIRSTGTGNSVAIMNEARDLELYADPVIDRVFLHLIDNSVKHGRTVTEIRITAREEETGCTIIYEDNGVGIPHEKRKDLFTKGFGKATGFNLFFVHDILNVYGMGIEEKGEPGKGVRFVITVPKELYRFVSGTGERY